ncbi:MAG: hypothetical protein ACO372_05950 [Methylophilaceae bacterium]
MQEEKEKMVDIDTSGPGADIELPEEKQEDVVETKEDSSSAPQEPREEKVEASDEKPEAKEQKDELQDYSKDVQRRIAKLTKKWREAERQREDALTFARIQKDKAEELSKKYETLESASLKSREEKLKSSLEAAKIKLASARDAGDINLEFEAQRELANAGYEEARLKELKALAESQPKQVVTPSDVRIPQQPQQVVDPRAEDWASKNTWFGKDKAMTYTAFDIHRTLVEEEGYDPKSDEYYAEIDKRIRLDFPHKFDTTNVNSTKPTQTVASARRSVNNSGRKTVRLTPSQVAIAKKLGVPLEEYAKQLKITKEV